VDVPGTTFLVMRIGKDRRDDIFPMNSQFVAGFGHVQKSINPAREPLERDRLPERKGLPFVIAELPDMARATRLDDPFAFDGGRSASLLLFSFGNEPLHFGIPCLVGLYQYHPETGGRLQRRWLSVSDPKSI